MYHQRLFLRYIILHSTFSSDLLNEKARALFLFFFLVET